MSPVLKITLLAFVAFAGLALYVSQKYKSDDEKNKAESREIPTSIEGDEGLGRLALEVFKKECSPWFTKHEGDVERVSVDIRFDVVKGDFKREKFGWKRLAWIRVFVRDEVPETLAGQWKGHTFHYWIGSGLESGLIGGGKAGGRAPCQLTGPHPKIPIGPYWFRPIAGAAFLRTH